jgi:Tol biopolymer transport system component
VRRLLFLFTIVALVVGGMTVAPRSAVSVAPGTVGRIVFSSDRDDGWGEVYTRDFAGGAWKRLTTNPTGDGSPDWSPDGSEIVYASDAAGTFDIWLMDADGSNQRNLTKDTAYDDDPQWSPDGMRIAFSNDDGDIWVMNPDGSGKVNLTPTVGNYNWEPSWSPDGSKIAFWSTRDGWGDIFVMDVDGSNVTNLTNSGTRTDADPAWSPDGSKIAFTSCERLTNSPNPCIDDLYVMGSNGSNVQRLTWSPASVRGPAWSPDGRHISFFSEADGDYDLWMVNPDGSNLGHLTNDPGGEWDGAWESVNRLPSAVDDGPYYVRPGWPLYGTSVLANDTDPDGDALRAQLNSAPSHVTGFTLAADGTFTYQHDGSAAMTDSFTYRVEDSRSGGSAPATVTIRVGVPDTTGLVDPATGLWRLRDGSGVVSQFYYGNPRDYPFAGDWDCDGLDSPGLYRQSDGFAYLRNTNTQGNANLTFFFGDPGDVPIAGDFNGNGCDTLSIYRPSEARFYIINQLGKDGGGLGAADYSFLFGDPGDKPVVGDWDGDGVDEIGLHRETTGFFYYRNTLTTGIADGQFFFGDPGDRLVAGDWGVVDGVETPGLYRPSNTTFYFRHTLTQGNADSQSTWTGATPSWQPIAGDFGTK